MTSIEFPKFSGTRCLMMPYVQGEPASVPRTFAAYDEVIASLFLRRGDIGYLTIDEAFVEAGQAHRGQRAKHGRALHTEAGLWRGTYGWGSPPSPGWGSPPPPPRPGWGRAPHKVTLDWDTRVLIGSNLDDTCAVWDAEHEDTSEDGDIGDVAHLYPYADAVLLKAGEVREIGILTPHESLPVKGSVNRQFLRIVSSGVHGREDYFTKNPLMRRTEMSEADIERWARWPR